MRVYIINYQDVPWGKELTKSLLNLPLFVFLNCFTRSLDYSGRTSPLLPCASTVLLASSFARGRRGNIPHRSSSDHLAGTRVVMGSSASGMDSCCPCSLGFPSVFFHLGFGLPARDVRESAGRQRILCQTYLQVCLQLMLTPNTAVGRLTDRKKGISLVPLENWPENGRICVESPFPRILCGPCLNWSYKCFRAKSSACVKSIEAFGVCCHVGSTSNDDRDARIAGKVGFLCGHFKGKPIITGVGV